MTLPPKRVNFTDYLSANKAVLLVILVAFSSAAISIFHKYLLNAGVSIISAYFYLKLFQFVFLVLHASRNGAMNSSWNTRGSPRRCIKNITTPAPLTAASTSRMISRISYAVGSGFA